MSSSIDPITDAEFRVIEPDAKDVRDIVPAQLVVPIDESIPGPRIPCVLLLDTSASMSGERISKLNNLLREVHRALMDHDSASLSVELAVITFSTSASVDHDFGLPHQWNPPTLKASGATAMGAAVELGLDLLEARKRHYKERGFSYHRPWMVILTDGAATDDTRRAFARLGEYQRRKKVVLIPFGIGEDPGMFQTLRNLSDRALPIDENRWPELIRYLIQNFKSVSQSQPEEMIGPSDPSHVVHQHNFAAFMNQ